MAIQDMTAANRDAWNAQRYDAWTAAYGSPAEEAERIVSDPARVLRRLTAHLGDVKGKRICSVQGSLGRVAVALALLGAKPLVIDFSEENRRYALELAAAADVSIDYAVCDVMQAGALGYDHRFDALVLELGVLHYHQDLRGFFRVMRMLAAPGGRMVLNEFHPVQRKLFWADGPRDYFRTELVEADVPNPDRSGGSLGKCLYRFWTMGEIVTATVRAGFQIVRLEEAPDTTDAAIPGAFTLVGEAA